MDIFLQFLNSLKNKENSNIIESIRHGFLVISESLSTDDANSKKYGFPMTSQPSSNAVNLTPNSNNEFFNQTLPDKMLKKVNKSQFGKKIGIYPKSGRSSLTLDDLNSNQGSYQNANISSGEWAGSSGGYSLGGPTQGSTLANM